VLKGIDVVRENAMQIKTSDVEDIARMAIFFLWILGFVFTAPVYARPGENIHFERISREQGLSQVSVLCIIQDRQGFMWFGTQDGLNKYDGYQFVIYRHDPGNINSLSGNYIRSIHEDTVGNLWIGTQGGGLNKFDRKTETFTRYQNQADNPKSLSENQVWSIYEDTDGNLWIGTRGGGLNKFDRKTETFTRYQNQADNPKSLSDNRVRSIYEDAEGNLWIGILGGGLNKFDRKTETFTRYQNQADNPKSLSHNNVLSIYGSSPCRVGGFGLDLRQHARENLQA
jgi:ligand-binding sensor domain-containing protein